MPNRVGFPCSDSVQVEAIATYCMTALHSQPYKNAIERVVQRRLDLGWSQEELARRLPRYERSPEGQEEPGTDDGGGQLQSFVSKFEQCQRRLDVIEFEHVCHVLGLRVADALDEGNWDGEAPPAVVPRARQQSAEERKRAGRRVKPGRKPATPATSKKAPAPGQPWPRTTHGGAGHSVEDPALELPKAADAPPDPPPAKGRKPLRRRS